MHMSYWRFAAMIATSTTAMFVLMYFNTYAFEHVQWSETRFWMAFVMGAAMAVIMLSFMLSMYKSKVINIAIFLGSIAVFSLALWLVRSQVTINDADYMKAMVPHHSIAIMTSERANISDPRVRKLADEIMAAQRREIAEMKYLVEELEGARSGDAAPRSVAEGPDPEVVPASEALASPNLSRLDPGGLDQAEIDKALPAGSRCNFAYTKGSPPVLAGAVVEERDETLGVVKLHGRLVEVTSDSADLDEGATFTADGIRLTVRPEAEGGGAYRAATLEFELRQGLKVGYRGWYSCR